MKSFRPVVKWLVIAGLFVFTAAIFSPLFVIRHQPGSRAICHSNLKQMGLAVKQYIQDNDEHQPLVTRGKVGWSEVLQRYTTWNNFQCPGASTAPEPSLPTRAWRYVMGEPKRPPSTDYWYNARLAKRKEADVDSVALTVLFGDGIDNAKTNAALSKLPPQWLKAEKSPAYRHLDGINIAFADGHVRWMRPEKVTPLLAEKGQPTFSLK